MKNEYSAIEKVAKNRNLMQSIFKFNNISEFKGICQTSKKNNKLCENFDLYYLNECAKHFTSGSHKKMYFKS